MDGQQINFAFKFLFAIETGMNSGSYVPLDLVDFTFFPSTALEGNSFDINSSSCPSEKADLHKTFFPFLPEFYVFVFVQLFTEYGKLAMEETDVKPFQVRKLL